MKKSGFLVFTLLLSISIPFNAYAMHIAEGYLALNWCIFYFILSAPFIILSIKELRKTIKRNSDIKMLLALMGAYVFMMSALKLPSVTGSSSHPTGTGLGAVVFGPMVMVVISAVVLLFQALLLAHGGLTTLGANVLSMGIVGPFVAYFIYRLFKKKNESVAVFLACALGNLLTYVVTSIQLALAFPSADGGVIVSAVKFLGVFAVTQVPLAIVEGIVSVVIFDFIKKHCRQELSELEGGLL
ncbi:energy-coupling factor ABC transporter permease [Clostridium septicum]|uniref:Cobalt transport protein CbiM n=1 Tax=Clostridium septicum TaxID=1504 RepID=A0A9N7JJH6_CLOSE|nr:energy-coupling factor ABC transporter permease [Clostridium septicum]AYE33215.1 energy-coupling factor ABC transporter permease [Clostridium septicum]MDU1314408.1 energy-coupling factor ABC transporter permease [Clostridium septicum]QAS61387.1 energy-coupling factor ABC transporter permease [Clostridium septicum]UEC22182.1 energy-coupling factor ABC transporter permease [Clostridium septicum]USR99788.1 energy-coupling factor ABC transporter permease [Clostridium septicum]